MSPDYQIITQDLVLRLISSDECQDIQQCVIDSPSLHRWIDWCHAAFSLDDAERFVMATRLNWVKSEAYGFGVFCRTSNQLLGMVAINELYHTFNMASIGYWIADRHQGKGYANKAVSALAEFCFAQLKLTRIEVVCDPSNLPSQKLIESCGGVFEVKAKNRFIFNGQPKTGLVYSLIPE
ncbi:ribosomal-protein-serine acetyltransferase [Vibrio galatheae]|uniref:Ribosomal-protein-serine acetyltransferase n=1 Tax=Vibrio galatheae TaxID=579748 RepID=A0A0F4NIS6_9VIBR|nr:GNAT family N-acetyltransferase [Vibrio galatheae]KJY83035.1 ribosomal-protein-serine acetyltransferase [Vibrio galatheae]